MASEVCNPVIVLFVIVENSSIFLWWEFARTSKLWVKILDTILISVS